MAELIVNTEPYELVRQSVRLGRNERLIIHQDSSLDLLGRCSALDRSTLRQAEVSLRPMLILKMRGFVC